MKIRAAVVDPLPLYRQGVASSLKDIGVTPETPDDIWAWTADGEIKIVLLSLCTPADWQLLADLRAGRPDVLLLALIEAPDTGTYLRALTLGAMPRESTSDTLRQVVSALVSGQVILPAEVVLALVGTQLRGVHGGGATPSPQEIAWLRRLADGSTVAQLAQRAGYSVREMFRRLRALYAKIAVKSRTEALIYAHDMGWI